jgi:hypothetical protein
LCTLLLLFIVPAMAANEARFVFGDSACPDPRALEAEVVRLTPSERRQELFEAVRVNVSDAGDEYRVTLIASGDRQDKSFTDPSRDCIKRARFAAVFVVVALFPPELDIEPAEELSADGSGEQTAPGPQDAALPVEPRVPEPAPKSPAKTPSPSREPDTPDDRPFDPIARIELTAESQLAPELGDSVGMYKLGGAVLAVLGRGGMLLTLGMGYTLPARFDAGLVRARMTELPARAGFRLPWESGRVGFALDFGATGALRRLRGRDAVVPHRASELRFGARCDVGLFYRLTPRIRVLGGVHASVEPGPSRLRALPYGDVGNMPWLWLGARLGLGVAL